MRIARRLQRTANAESLFGALVAASGYLLVATVVLIFVFIFSRAYPLLHHTSLGAFLWGTVWLPVSSPPQFGIIPFLVGSLLIVSWALIVGVPLGLACAVYLSEMASYRVRSLARPVVGLLAGIPSVVYGIIGLLVVAPRVAEAFSVGTGLTGFTAGIVLGLMIVPTVSSLAEESILSVPREYREAALALGATPFEAFWTVVVPAARSGITASFMLAAGRALGETMTVLIVGGGRLATPTGLLQPMRTMTAVLASEINNAPQGGVQYSALFAVGAVLVSITFALTLLIDAVLTRARKEAG